MIKAVFIFGGIWFCVSSVLIEIGSISAIHQLLGTAHMLIGAILLLGTWIGDILQKIHKQGEAAVGEV